METRALKFTLEIEIEIDGKIPPDSIINDRIIDALNDAMPSIFFDDDELDCMVCVNNWEYVPNRLMTEHLEPKIPAYIADCPKARTFSSNIYCDRDEGATLEIKLRFETQPERDKAFLAIRKLVGRDV